MALPYSTGSNPQSNSYSVPQVDTIVTSLMDWGNMPQVRRKMVGANPKQYGLDILMGLNMIQESVQGNNYWWLENNLFIKVPKIGATPTTDANYVYLTYDATSHDNSGKVSWGRVGETVMLENGLQGQIDVKNVTTDSAHVLSVKPIGSNADGSAVSIAQLAAGTAIGQSIITLTNATYEGAAGMNDSILSSTSTFSNNVQNITEVHTGTFNQKNTASWFEPFGAMPRSGSGESSISAIWNKSLGETEIRFERQMLQAIFNGPGGTRPDPTDATKTIPFTTGWLPTLLNFASQVPYFKIDRKLFEVIRATGRNNFSQGAEEMEYNALVGDNARNEIEEFFVSYKVNRPDGTEMSRIDTTSKSVDCSGVMLYFLPCPIMSAPFTYGQLGDSYSSLMILTPSGTTDDGAGGNMPTTIVRYMPRPNRNIQNGKPWYEAEIFGFEKANDFRDITSVRYKATAGAEIHRSREAIVCQKIS